MADRTNRKENRLGKHEKWIWRLCAVLAFVGAACGIAYYNLKTAGSLYLQSDDGDLYLSIARNLLQNAHFIQTARPIEAFVVPPGLPAMCTVLLFLFGGLSRFLVGEGFCAHLIGGASADMLGLLGFQYLVYGLAAAFVALTALKLAFHGLNAAEQGIFVWSKKAPVAEPGVAKSGDMSLRQAQGPTGQAQGPADVSSTGTGSVKDVPSTSSGTISAAFPWILSAAIGVLVPAFYVWCSIRIRHPNPGFLLTENYVVCLIALVLWLVVKGADVRRIVPVTFVLTLFRPACSLLLIAAFVWMVLRAFRDRYAKNKPPIRERVRFYDIFVMLAVFALAIGINIGVNYLETGEIIPLEDYGNLDVYLANNDKASPEWYHSGKVPEFASVRYNQIILNESLTRYRQNELAGEALREYVKANTGTVVRNACTRFVRLFCETWGAVFYAFLVCLAAQIVLKGLKWPRKAYILLMTVFLSVPPAFGLLVARYSAPMLPLFIAVIIGTAGQVVCMAAAREKKDPVPVAAESKAEPVAEKKPGATVEEPVSEKTEEHAAETVSEPVEGTPAASAPDASAHFDKLNDRSASEPIAEIPEEAIIEETVLEEPEEIPEETIEEIIEDPLEESVEETVEEVIEESVEEAAGKDKPESVEIEESEADIPLPEAVKTLSAHELAAKLFPKKTAPGASTHFDKLNDRSASEQE